ncbi:MAG TPA: lmo0937 family membrane protein [bacterium]|nr:lmo0937 family membrane protein [bacterium]
MLWTLFLVLLILWLAGFGFSVGGSLIHLLLVVALIVLIYNLATGRRTVA